jgi:hypothetical protein
MPVVVTVAVAVAVAVAVVEVEAMIVGVGADVMVVEEHELTATFCRSLPEAVVASSELRVGVGAESE